MTPGTREFALMEQEMLLGGTPGMPTPAALRLGTPAAIGGVASKPMFQTPTPVVPAGTPAAMATTPAGTPSMGVVHNFIRNMQYDARPSSGTPAGTPSGLGQGEGVGGTPTLWGDLLNPAYGSIPEQQGVENDVKVLVDPTPASPSHVLGCSRTPHGSHQPSHLQRGFGSRRWSRPWCTIS